MCFEKVILCLCTCDQEATVYHTTLCFIHDSYADVECMRTNIFNITGIFGEHR